MSLPSYPAGRSRPAPWSANTCRSPPPCSARATTPSPPTSSGPRPTARAAPPPGCAAPARRAARPARAGTRGPLARMRRYGAEPDRWLATVVPDREGRWTFRVEAWSDPLATWHHAVEVKIDAGQGPGELANDLEEGARLLERVAADGDADWRGRLTGAAAALRDTSLTLHDRVAPALAAEVQDHLDAHPVRELVTATADHEVWVDRPQALYGSWYEFFPRSEGPAVDGVPTHGH